jgi:hypothetical protein
LGEFTKRKIIIPDNDEASLLTIEFLNNLIEDLYVIDIISDDKDDNFIDDIKKFKILKASSYLLKKYKIFS